MPQDDPITVRIFEQNYRVSSEQGDAKYIEKAAEYLDQKMQEAAKIAPRKPLGIAILAAMNIAEEVLEARKKKEPKMKFY